MKYSIVILLCVFLICSCDKNKNVDNTSTPISEVSEASNTQSSYKDISVSEALSVADAILLDVRTQGEVDAGSIPNAVHIDFRKDNFKEEISKLDKSKTYVVYCKSGGRSAQASQMMVDMGFENVANMLGGYDNYKSQ